MKSNNLWIDIKHQAKVNKIHNSTKSIFTIYQIMNMRNISLLGWVLRRERTSSVAISITNEERNKFLHNNFEIYFDKLAKTRQKFTNIRACAKSVIKSAYPIIKITDFANLKDPYACLSIPAGVILTNIQVKISHEGIAIDAFRGKEEDPVASMRKLWTDFE